MPFEVRTGRYAAGRPLKWSAEVVAGVLMKTFPCMQTIGVNVEISFEAESSEQSSIMELLRIFTAAGIRVIAFEVQLIQLPSSVRKCAERLSSISRQLKDGGVIVAFPPRTRSTKAVPNLGFELPALINMCAPAAIRHGIAKALWDIVW